MAIAFDNATSNTSGSSTFNHTVSGSDRILVVAISPVTSNTITGVTYNSVAMTFLTSYTSGARTSYIYYQIAPSTGSHTVSISSSLGTFMYATASSYTGVAQTSPIDNSTTSTSSSGTTQSASLTTLTDNCWVIESASADGGSALSAGTSTTLRGTSGRLFNIFDNNAAKTPAGSVTLQTTTTGSDLTYNIIFSIKPKVQSTYSTQTIIRQAVKRAAFY